jgi:hypothetical protein
VHVVLCEKEAENWRQSGAVLGCELQSEGPTGITPPAAQHIQLDILLAEMPQIHFLYIPHEQVRSFLCSTNYYATAALCVKKNTPHCTQNVDHLLAMPTHHNKAPNLFL